MKYKLLALDIDDTITKPVVDTMSVPVLKALQEVSKKISITFVTARPMQGLIRFLDNANLPPQFHVVENGTKVIRPDRSIVYDRHIAHEEVQTILNVARPYFLEPGFLADEHWVDGSEAQGNVSGLSFSCISKKDAELLKNSVLELDTKYTVYSGRHWTKSDWRAVLVFHKNATKGSGMKYIQTKLGISKEETIAVGDGMTDVSMFDAAGLKVAMENGEQKVKDAAEYICPSVDKDGILEVIRKYIS
ncbi:hypothetical protein CO051_00515 [Candidatus Roizmanbacteria bacterium CG_4_9_14_0_2_um_filter_39_13]|uniref:Cof-type HAD-IIB family hydrolase n=1 Tax=Candidatus Roizmanbacteria bacterium CG_4_9_14_0_2_um_filter_39_13 TaxID=1974839 RepID=A0A2M8F432_9BACT|nr:MAG: hypothetical protein COY15_03785 [Candidatus Roizmanbacteria bacterium CG_4_10_14_0_2_um_filter_39_12]PJC34042.1 MAG: hypothetical protein CO051_00515 [Candidatus Roizmanbacteria bacterium CG_4_9_14_0_2_um_filter_39_13]